ncbi:ralf-like 4, RAPID ALKALINIZATION FACTOR 4 [Hibiscus trionum]|uniref:Ralf-like 4, RAPID ALKALINIZATION FACTOR 4 n=1 Tax=Hibiscus trionum TaxID=183268 RepID=A0A9W7MT39_HIBTR|nr:ralf-like 4, RAPID ALKALINIZATION FACTOR 4 [Hibiscus trionum]
MGSKVWAMMGLLAWAMVAECTKFHDVNSGVCHGGGHDNKNSCTDRHRDNVDVSGVLMDSEPHARQLAARRAISYEALKHNALPCNIPGRSYYACQGGGPANPYTRGCHAATGCARVYN